MIHIICLARQNSSRLPNKIFADINGKMAIEWVIDKLLLTKAPFSFAIPSSDATGDLGLFLRRKNIKFFSGDEDDVLSRFVGAAHQVSEKFVQRYNCDNLLVHPDYIRACHQLVKNRQEELIFSNTMWENHNGQSVEIIQKNACNIGEKPSQFEEEHVFPYFYNRLKPVVKLPKPIGRLGPLDTLKDLDRIKKHLSLS